MLGYVKKRGRLLLYGVGISPGRGDYLSSERDDSADLSASLLPARHSDRLLRKAVSKRTLVPMEPMA